jgi:hypothetical protein
MVDDGLPLHTLTKREYDAARNGSTPAESPPTNAVPAVESHTVMTPPATDQPAAVRRRPGRPRDTRQRNRQRRWPPGRSCEHCGEALTPYQSRYCSNDCRMASRATVDERVDSQSTLSRHNAPDGPVPVSSAAVSAPLSEAVRQDEGHGSPALPFTFLQTLPSFVTAVEVDGWRLTRRS